MKYFIYHLTYYRILVDGYKEHQLQNEFWTLTIDAHLLRAINWCMVFGSKSEPTHWRHLTEESESHAQNFRNGLFSEIGLSEIGWRKYWTDMKQFRDKWVAHRELKPFTDPVPNFDTALAVVYHYDNWVRDVISPHSLDEPPFKLFAASLRELVTPFSTAPNDFLRIWPVSKRVNVSGRGDDDPSLIAPVADEAIAGC